MWQLPKVERPVTLTVFGATGDLFARKIVPALYLLFRERKLPDIFSVIGFGRRPLDDISFREQALAHLQKASPAVTAPEAASFLSLFSYRRGEFSDPAAFVALGKTLAERDRALGIETLKSFYLAVPPEMVPMLAPRIAEAAPSHRLADGSTLAWGLLIEKPFGTDETSARALSAALHEYFDENELFRIDHYLAKPALDALLHARTTHPRYDALLAREKIRGITITLFETLGVESRGAFYDSVGALRDVGQNHLLEMLALAIMPIPNMDAAHVCGAREAFMQALPQLSPTHIAANTIRAQHEGYCVIAGVGSESQTETYFRLAFSLTQTPYTGVPVVLQAGKRMSAMQKDIVIAFDCDHTDTLHIELEPVPCIYTKKDGVLTMISEFTDPEPSIQYANEYASLFAYAWRGDHTFFPAEKEVEYQWRFVDPIIALWQEGMPPMRTYIPNTMLPWKK